MDKKTVANIIVDLYTMRASLIPPTDTRGVYRFPRGYVENLAKYNFFDAAIAKIYDKYKISATEVEDVIMERSINEQIN